MPTDFTVMTTEELKEFIQDPAKAQERNAAVAELLHSTREIGEEDTEDEAMRGGIRPTRRPS